MLINRLAIIGVGLIGGSLARALKSAGVCQTVIGHGRNEKNLTKAKELGVIDEYSLDLAEVISSADVIVLATPLSSTEFLLKAVAENSGKDTIITDVGSIKISVIRSARSILGDHLKFFIPGHPVAGTEQSGVEASFSELFKDHLVILTPLEESHPDAQSLIKSMWEACGAKVVFITPEYHDQVLAATSHLPHLLAYALVHCLETMDEREEIFKFAAGGFKDFTRIASSNPEMWSDICLSNQDYLLKALELFISQLEQITGVINNNDRDGLLQIFSSAKHARDQFLEELDSNTNLGSNK